MKKPRKVRRRYVAASGAPFSDEDIQIIGEELAKIAEAHSVGDVRSLDHRLVFKIVKSDPNHPLRQFYNWNVREAAEKHWLEHTRKIICSVRIVTAKVGQRETFAPMFVDASVSDGRKVMRRTRVLRDDALVNDPISASHVGFQIRRIRDAVTSLETYTSEWRRPPKEVIGLRARLRQALDWYETQLASGEEAAE